MGKTTIALDDATKDELDAYQVGDHDSANDTLRALLNLIPHPEDMYDKGCANPECGKTLPSGTSADRYDLTIEHMNLDPVNAPPINQSNFFCSPGCAVELQEHSQEQAPSDPDKVIVGGHDEMRFEFGGARYRIDGHTEEVSLGIPGALTGQDSHGYEFDYEGEPVYIHNAGRVVQMGIVDEVINEESHTAIIMGHGNLDMQYEHHPNEAKAQEYFERQEE
jgi:hypothetical protein